MSKKTLITIFLVSVIFNFAFIGTFIYLHFFAHRPPAPFPAERYIPQEYKDRFSAQKQELAPLHRELRELRKSFLQSLMQEDFDREESVQKLQESIKKHMELEKRLGKHLIELRKSMTAEQARKFLRLRHLRNRRLEEHGIPQPREDFRKRDNFRRK